MIMKPASVAVPHPSVEQGEKNSKPRLKLRLSLLKPEEPSSSVPNNLGVKKKKVAQEESVSLAEKKPNVHTDIKGSKSDEGEYVKALRQACAHKLASKWRLGWTMGGAEVNPFCTVSWIVTRPANSVLNKPKPANAHETVASHSSAKPGKVHVLSGMKTPRIRSKVIGNGTYSCTCQGCTRTFDAQSKWRRHESWHVKRGELPAKPQLKQP